MAKLLCISAQLARVGISEEGDIVQIEEDSYEFGDAHSTFDIRTAPGTKAEAIAELAKLDPDTSHLDTSKEEDRDKVQVPKYGYKVVNAVALTVTTMCESKMTIKA